jgi:hypothetical protein
VLGLGDGLWPGAVLELLAEQLEPALLHAIVCCLSTLLALSSPEAWTWLFFTGLLVMIVDVDGIGEVMEEKKCASHSVDKARPWAVPSHPCVCLSVRHSQPYELPTPGVWLQTSYWMGSVVIKVLNTIQCVQQLACA